MNSYFNLIYLIILLIFVIIAAYILTPLFLPNPTDLVLYGNFPNPKNKRDYLYLLYNNGDYKDKNYVLEDIINYKFLNYHKITKDKFGNPKLNTYDNIKSSLNYFNFIYENAPTDIKSSYNTAINTTVSWPPKYNEKFRLLAFPYVSGNIITGLYQTLAAKSGTATMPCWYISKYDSNNYSESLYNKIFDRNIIYDNTGKITYEQLLTFFGKVVEYERFIKKENDVTSGDEQSSNIIKTGGYILEDDYKIIQQYGGWDNARFPTVTASNIKKEESEAESESGRIGSCYLEVQHTCFPMPGYDYPYCDDGSWWTYLSVGSGIYWNCKRPIIAKNKLHLLYCCGWSINNFVDITKDFGGGKNLIKVILNFIYNNEHPNATKAPTGLGFRKMEGKNGDVVVRKFFVSFTIFLFICIYLLILIIKNVYDIFKNFNDKSYVILKSTYIIICLIIIFSIFWYWIFISVNDLFIGLGWMTLDMAYEKTGLSPYKFFEEAIFGYNSNPICNGLNMTEWFDEFLYPGVTENGFLSAIMTQQPNKSGCWMVEMFDIEQYVLIKNKYTPSLGICGKQKLASGIQYYNNKNNDYGKPTILGTIPKNKNCFNVENPPSSLEECDELKNDSKVYNCYGCNDSNKSLCISCKGVPISSVCLSNKKIHYSA